DDGFGGDCGAIYVLDGRTGATIQRMIDPAPSPFHGLGAQLGAGNGRVYATTSNAVYAYDLRTAEAGHTYRPPVQTPPSARFGTALAAVGSRLLVGGLDQRGASVVYVFGKDGEVERQFPGLLFMKLVAVDDRRVAIASLLAGTRSHVVVADVTTGAIALDI